jgi:Dolichyl-phosphate-mannose-protein mannosyltransferase
VGARVVIRSRLRGFWPALGAIVLGALALRLAYALGVMGDHRFTGDAVEFHFLARNLANTGSYVEPFAGLVDPRLLHLGSLGSGTHPTSIPTAEKPPLYPAYLAIWMKLGLSSFRWDMVASCLLGAGTVAAIGAIGRRVAGARAGLIAAGVAAVYPGLVVLDGAVRSESLYVLLVALALLAAYRLADAPSWRRAATLGAAIGLAVLTRSEGLLLILLLGLPAVALAVAGRRDRLRFVAAVVAGCAVLVVPWLARNWIAFDRPTPISTNQGGLLAGANCDRAYHGAFIGMWACFPQPPRSWGTNESVISGRLQGRALRYAGDHAGRVPVVAGVRLLRTWELWDPRDHAGLEAVFNDRNPRVNRAAQICLYVLVLLAAAGAVVLRRREQPLRLLLALPALVSVVAVMSYGASRFRAAAEVAIVVLAAVALQALVPRALESLRHGRARDGMRLVRRRTAP